MQLEAATAASDGMPTRKVEVATDGFVVYENSGFSRVCLQAAIRVLQAAFTAEQDLPALSHDRGSATSDIGPS